MADQEQRGLAHAAARAANDPFFLGYLFESMIKTGRVTRDAVASRLGCSLDRLFQLYLCRTPRDDALSFREDVVRIASFAGCDAAALAQFVREAGALQSMRGATPQRASSFLLAARDRIDPDRSDQHPKEPHA
jgi:hypothetical protein